MGVTSLPVPAVVGTIMVGRPGLGTRSTPKYSAIVPLLVAMMADVLAMSIGLPPPIPMIRFTFSRWICSEHSVTISYLGSGSTASKTAYLMRDSFRDFSTGWISPAPISPLSVTIRTFFPPRLKASCPICPMAPGPTTILGVVLKRVILFIIDSFIIYYLSRAPS